MALPKSDIMRGMKTLLRFSHTLFVSLLLLLVACGTETAGIRVTDVWGRASTMMTEAGAFYMVIENKGAEADALVAVEADICGVTELHESSLDDAGVMRMRPVTGGRVELPAGSAVELKTGGLHVMCLQKQEAFVVGATVPLTLVFENAPPLQVEAEIR